MTGTTIAQVIPIAITPILTRIYTPEEFGVLAIFMALCSVLGVIANGRYELAVLSPETEKDAYNIAALSLFITLTLATVTFLFMVFLAEEIAIFLSEPDIEMWLYLVPFVVIFIGIFNAFNYLNIRQAEYGTVSQANILKGVGVAGTQATIGYSAFKGIGLITGYILGAVVISLRLAFPFIKKKIYKELELQRMIKLAIRYKEFPYFSTFSALANTGSQQVPVIMISSLFSAGIAGFYSVASRVLIMPVNVVGTAFGQVYFQKTSKLKSSNEIAQITLAVQKKLIFLAIVPFSVILAYGDLLTAILLGDSWIIAGQYMQYFSFWLYLVFITSPITNLYATLEKQKLAMYFNFIAFISRLTAIFIGFYFFDNATYAILFFAFISALLWAVWYGITLNLVHINFIKMYFMAITPFVMLSSLLLFIRYFYGN
ncbi:oligosaccharide flippase family protein [Pseudoalteromonas sp. Ps84H-4]|nr:oligosaccharide flippase family protein [Pseudoalteromonas sp. Ps84H-4]